MALVAVVIGSSGKTRDSSLACNHHRSKREERLEAPNDSFHNKAWMTKDAKVKQVRLGTKVKGGSDAVSIGGKVFTSIIGNSLYSPFLWD